MSTTLRRAAPWLALVALLAVLGGAFLNEAHREVTDPGDTDFIAFATGARLVTTDPSRLYDPAAQMHVEATLLAIPASAHFLNPFTNVAAGAAILSPLAHTDLWSAALIAAVVSTALFALAMLLMSRLLEGAVDGPLRALIVVASVLCIPAVDAINQWDSLLAVAVLGSVLLARRGHLWLAGLALATLVLKPQDVWLVVPALVAARSWRFLGGLGVGAAGWLAASVAFTGVGGLTALARIIVLQHVAETDATIGLPSLVATVSGVNAFGWVAAGVVGVAVTALLWWRRDVLTGRPLAAVAIGVPLSLLCSPHVMWEDLMLAALPLAFVAQRWPWLALAEALAINLAAIVQLGLQPNQRHLQPFVLLAVTASAWIAVARHPRETDFAPVQRAARHRRTARSPAFS
ncbi:MAG: glycosyltransferase family 87 protein [Candidatus Dormibacteria bacterium]